MVRKFSSPATIHVSVFLILLISLMLPAPAHAIADVEVPHPTLDQFVVNVANGEPDDLRGLYVTGLLADAIVGQPEDMPAYVSSEDGILTHFELTESYGSYGLLAHNYLAGGDFFELDKGQKIHLIFGDAQIETFVVVDIQQYQALSPNSVTSEFVELETEKHFSASQLFDRVFNRPGHVVLQTCIYADGDSSWGRMFVIAVPLSQYHPRMILESPTSH